MGEEKKTEFLVDSEFDQSRRPLLAILHLTQRFGVECGDEVKTSCFI